MTARHTSADARIPCLRHAVEAMLEGEFHFALPPSAVPDAAPDEVDRLAQVLDQLGHSIAESIERLRSLAELAEKINGGLLPEEVLDHLFDSFHTIIPYDRIGCALLEDDGRVARTLWARTSAHAAQIGIGYAAPLAKSSLCEVLRTGRPRIIDDLVLYRTDHPRSSSTMRMLAEGIRSSLTCPLIAMSKPIGFLFFSSQSPHAYSDAHVAFFERIAGQVSTVLEKARIYQELLDTKARLEVANSGLERLASVDALTGVANRRQFDVQLGGECVRASRGQTALALLVIDVDRFKALNDGWGHATGDACLTALGRILAGCARRPGDLAARFGGDEFALLLPAVDPTGARAIAEGIRADVAAWARAARPDGLPMTVSIGLGTMNGRDGPITAAALFAAADQGLYAAKEAGRDSVGRSPARASAKPDPSAARAAAEGEERDDEDHGEH
ncbi:MAG: diguanylate cyclase [Pseudomonadota bacterium]|nr:diguanylate cyclase [Pseudomonadota bacterium]